MSREAIYPVAEPYYGLTTWDSNKRVMQGGVPLAFLQYSSYQRLDLVVMLSGGRNLISVMPYIAR